MGRFIASDKKYRVLIIFFAVALGVLVRYPYLVSTDKFPAGDGGLFMEMIYSIKDNGYLLPSFVNFNNTQIPFAYPPVGFYLALLSAKIFGISILQSAQLLPVVLNLLTIAAFVLLASELEIDKVELFLCAGVFSISLQAYLWTVKGGGLSRSPGFLFTTLSLYLFLLYLKRDGRIYLILSAVAIGFAAASHLEWGLISIASLPVFVYFFKRYKTRQDIYNLAGFGLLAALVTVPWWGTVLYRFGMNPFLSAWNVAEMNASQFIEKFFTGAMFKITVFPARDFFLPVLALIGFLTAFFSKDRLFLPIWLAVTYIVAPKNSPISGLLPLAILTAAGLRSIDRGVNFLLGKIKKNGGRDYPPGVGVLYLLLVILLSAPVLFEKPVVQTLNPVERAAMEYVKENSPDNARFIVLTSNDWHSADAAEWFPYLSQRQSLTTPQGLEWVSAQEFEKIVGQVAVLSQMVRNEQAGMEAGLLADFIESNFTDYDYVAIFAGRIEKEFGGFLDTDRFEVFYRKSDVLILRRIPNSQ